jgi:hypothetical protein
MRLAAFVMLVVAATSMLAATIDNDHSCDVVVLPAATLLLPYFEVDVDHAGGETTLFTITNVTNTERIVRVTLWTDYAYPILAFNVYLTGYDVQSINLYDVIARGRVAPDDGTGTELTPRRGLYSDPNHDIDLTGCARLPAALDASIAQRMRSAFTLGVVSECKHAGGTHANAIGYATIDVVRTCSGHLPTDRLYWIEDIAFDNVLIGDYLQVDGGNDYAQGNPLVHIRAIPEGGTPAERRATPRKFDAGFPRTFYRRYQAASEPRFDGRQPLPSTFAAHWFSGRDRFFTSMKIWREGLTAGASCVDAQQERELDYVESVAFDENENAAGNRLPWFPNLPIFPLWDPLPPTSMKRVRDEDAFAAAPNGAVAGWLYLNLDKCFSDSYGCQDAVVGQNWVIASTRKPGHSAADADAHALGNGCSPSTPESEISSASGGVVVGPAANINPSTENVP